ncbi:MAG: outer membrane protein assembly factor BamA [Balneolaceae bacterium]
MSRFFSFFFCLILCGILAAPHLSAQDRQPINITDPTAVTPRQYEIQTVTVSGLRAENTESHLISRSGLVPGSTITIPGEDIPEAIRRIYRGGLYSDVQIYPEVVGGGVNIEIVVQEEPRLAEYQLEGVRRSDRRELRERITLLQGFAVSSSNRTQAVNTIQRYFRGKGYWGTSVEIEEIHSNDLTDRVTLVFQIDPGDRLKVRRIQFFGNEQFSGRKLRNAFDTIKQDRWWRIFRRHVYTSEEVEEGKLNLLDFYRENGHRDVRILSDSVYVYDWRGDKEGVSIDISVEEGPQYKVRNITWEGNTVYTDEQLTQVLDFYKGDVFNERKFQENLQGRRDEGDVLTLYHNVGYLFYRLYEDIQIVGEDSLDIHFDIVENEIATVREVSFHGNTKTHDDVVRRTLRTLPGQTYNRSAIIRSVRELSQLGYFNPEGIEPDLNPDQENQSVDLIFGLDESQSTDNFEFSGGFGGRQIGVILATRVNFNNFSIQRAFERDGWNPIPSGDGQKLSLGLQVTGRGYQSYSFSFQEPWLRGRPTSLGVSVSYDILNYRQLPGQSIREKNELFSSSISIGRRLNWPDDFFSQRTSLRYQLYDIAGSLGIFGEGKTNILSLTHMIERNSVDHPISPTTGTKLTLTGEVAPPLPGFGQYYKIKSQYQHHHNLIGQFVITGSADFGYMGHFGSGERSNFQRFFLGGTAIQQRQSFINDNIDMRGYPGGNTGVISPLDENRNLIGGSVYTKYSMEVRYPAVRSDQVQLFPYLFMDAGNTYLDFDSFDPFNVKRAAGLGARIYLPILGLVDISYGYRFDGTHDSNRGAGLQPGEWEFLFNMGASF